jgi:hypothetical protein
METASENPPELLDETSDEESADTLIAKRPAPIVLPHARYVHLDRACNGVWQVSHMVTQETKNLPEGDWSVVFDEDGYGCAIDISKDDGTPIFSMSFWMHNFVKTSLAGSSLFRVLGIVRLRISF